MKRTMLYLSVIVFTLCLCGCENIIVLFTHKKEIVKKQTPLQQKANAYFWKHFSGGNYDSMPQILSKLTAAYLENPNEVVTTSHLAWTHIWAISESSKMKVKDARVTDHMILAKKYFSEAYELNPNDGRILGFLAATAMSEGSIDKDDRKSVHGYFILKEAIDKYPLFNLFTGGYIMSRLPKDHDGFKEGLGYQWDILDECMCEKVDRENFDVRKYLHLATTKGDKRVCWNTPMVPHGEEAFFLNLGDMLVKNGEVEKGIKIYNNAKLTKGYDTWKFKDILDDRIKDAVENQKNFNQENLKDDRKVMMINSSFSCMGCHLN